MTCIVAPGLTLSPGATLSPSTLSIYSWATLLGGKVKRTVAAEYAALQEHVKKVGSFDWAERLYAAPLDGEGVILPPPMKVRRCSHLDR